MKEFSAQAFVIIVIIISTIIYGIFPKYVIYSSHKTNCDILLNTHNGDTWFNCDGYWQKSSKDIAK